MAGFITKNAARNIFIGGSVFFLAIYVALSAHTHIYMENTSTPELTESVVRGKKIWEQHSCINCHSLLGEGAYFAPELGNVWLRYGGANNPAGARAGIKAWMRAMPTNAPGRRQMPNFDLSEQELDDLIDFLEWTSRIDTQDWPPTIHG